MKEGYAILVASEEALNSAGVLITPKGTLFWITKEQYGIQGVEAKFSGRGIAPAPAEVMLFPSHDAAMQFADRLSCGPWYFRPIKSTVQVLQLRAVYSRTPVGYRARGGWKPPDLK